MTTAALSPLGLVQNGAWPRSLQISGTYYDKPFRGVVMDADCRWVGGTFIWVIALDGGLPREPWREVVMMYDNKQSAGMGHALCWGWD